MAVYFFSQEVSWDARKILVSNLCLQQGRADQVLPFRVKEQTSALEEGQ